MIENRVQCIKCGSRRTEIRGNELYCYACGCYGGVKRPMQIVIKAKRKMGRQLPPLWGRHCILTYLKENGWRTAEEIYKATGIIPRSIRYNLKVLHNQGSIVKQQDLHDTRIMLYRTSPKDLKTPTSLGCQSHREV